MVNMRNHDDDYYYWYITMMMNSQSDGNMIKQPMMAKQSTSAV